MDGHEWEDVIKSKREMLNHLKTTHLPPAPCSDKHAATPPPHAETQTKFVLLAV